MRFSAPTIVLVLALAACGSEREPAPAPEATTETPMASPTHFDAKLPGPEEDDPMALVQYWRQAVEAGDGVAARRAWRDDVRIGGMQPRWRVLKDIAVKVGEARVETIRDKQVIVVPAELTGTNADNEEQVLHGSLRLRRVPPLAPDGTEPARAAPDAPPPPWRIDSVDWEG